MILPGLVDLHGHPRWNIFAPWEPPRTYRSRHEWRDSDEYVALIEEPWKKITEDWEDEPMLRLLARYGDLCRRDHGRRHKGWKIKKLGPGKYQWTSPLGRVYITGGHDPPG